MSMYAVRKRRGAWTICDDQKPLMLLDSYEEALEVAQTAAVVMSPKLEPARTPCSEIRPTNSETVGSQSPSASPASTNIL